MTAVQSGVAERIHDPDGAVGGVPAKQQRRNGAPPTDDSPGEPTGAAESVDPDPGYRHDLGPPRDFLAQEPPERLRCAADRVGALIEQALLHLR